MTIQEELEKEFQDLYPEDRKKFEDTFFNDPDIKALKAQAQRQRMNYLLVQSIKTEEKIKKVELKTLQTYKRQMTRKKESIELLKLGLPREDLETIVNDLVGIHMLCDVLESFCNEIEWLIEKSAPDWKLDVFDNILQVGKKATEQLEWVYRNTDLMEHDSWGNECDKYVKMFRNKAAKLMRSAAEARARKKAKEATEENEQNDN